MNFMTNLPPLGEIVPGEGGHFGGIVRGQVIDGVREPDYALIVPALPAVRLEWGKYGQRIEGANSKTDGLRNTQAMLKAECPPALHIASLTSPEGHTDLYLPAQAELAVLHANVPELFDKAWHWSSTQGSPGFAFAQDFELGGSLWNFEDDAWRVRAVRRIPLQPFSA